MTTNRRDVRTAALTTADATGTAGLSHAQAHDHDHSTVPSDPALRVKALESLLVAKGLVDRATLDTLIDTYEHRVGPRNGARVVARAWVDSAFKQRLLTDADAALSELGYGGMQGEHMVVVENSSGVHFAEPWQAEAFALALRLSAQGLFTWKEWAAVLAEKLAALQKGGKPDDGSRYYLCWLDALEDLVVAKRAADRAALLARKHAWAAAYRRTTHGQPVELENESPS